MNPAGIDAFLRPGKAERDPAFREEQLRLSHNGLSLLGWVEIAVAAFMLGAEEMMQADRAVMSARFWQDVFVAGTGALTIAVAITHWSSRQARVMAAFSAWLAAAVLIWSSLLLMPGMARDDHFILGEITSVLLAAVALIPLLPVQTFTLGLSIGLFHLTASRIMIHAWDASQLVFILMLTLLSTGLSALIYEQRRSTYEAHRESLRITADLSNAQSRAMLAETAVAVGRLAASLTHELNTPLGALRSAADTMLVIAGRQATAAPAEQNRLVGMQAELHRSMRQSAERLSQVILRLRRLIELENNEKKTANLNELIQDVAILFEPQLGDSVKLEFDLQPLPPISCSPQQLSAVFSSLISNALNAIEREGRIRVATNHADSQIQVSVQDDGRGMKDEEVENIFDPGFRVSDGRVAAGNWSLFTSRQIVHEHGGVIRVESREGAGTTVTISLPWA